ncbi:MAG: SMI1/KNR4 family protein [Bacteroidetes bacterium]|nr:SMI1/KNR4 family protein [Bacteroidota bacterium]
MNHNNFTGVKEPVSDVDLQETEVKLNFIFPPEFREHYLNFNGGSPDKYLYKHYDSIFVVQQFLSVKYGRDTFDSAFSNLRELIPHHLIPFAFDPGGNYYCFSTDKADFASIYFWDHENYDDPHSGTIQISNSLTDFLSKLAPED